MGPGGSGNPVRTDGEDESFYWPSTIHQPLALLQVTMLLQLKEAPILRMAWRKSWASSTLWGDWGWTLKDAPGDFMLRGVPLKNLVTQLHKAETLGDLCQREHPCQRRTQNAMLGKIWPTGCPHHPGGLRRHHMKRSIGQDKARRLGPSQLKRMWILSAPITEAPPPATPAWGGSLPSGCWDRRQPTSPHVNIAPPSSLCKDPEPSPLHASEWIERHTRCEQTLPW